MSQTIFEGQVLESLNRSTAAFNEGLPQFFDEFATDAMIFTADSKTPIAGRETYRQNYESMLTSQKREKTILERNMQIIGDKAVVTQSARIAQGETSVDVLQTLVYGLTGEGVKVLHLHTALATPKDDMMVTPAVKVINEKIATVASVLGVAQ